MMIPINLRSFKQKVRYHKKTFRRFLGKLQRKPPKDLDHLAAQVDKSIWLEMDCLSCANCCKNMSPTFTSADIKRISAHLDMSPIAFKEKWLMFDKKDNDWVNKSQPCQFLDSKSNKCDIYEVRPSDCAGFPHITKRRMKDYIHVHQQNVEYCPATYRMVEKMRELIN